jgi:GTP-binding protein YchF
VEGSIDPKRDREIVEVELTLADLATLARRAEKVRGSARSGDKEKQRELALTEKLITTLKTGQLAITIPLSPEEEMMAKEFHLLTRKPMIYAANVGEEQLSSIDVHRARAELGLPETSQVISISAKIEEDLQDLSPEEAAAFLRELSIESSGLTQLIHAAYAALGYITFFTTVGGKELRAWNIRRGSTAYEAAGAIHTDFQRGFIRAETIPWEDFVKVGGEQKAKEVGKMRSEGKDYVVQDGDVMHFRFST